jgi:hypothetical protein
MTPINGDTMSTGQIVLIVINILLTMVGASIAFQIKRLYEAIDALASKDEQMEKQITAHREDMLKNYSSTVELNSLRNEVFKRFDRFEDNVMNAIRKIPGQ